MTDIPATTTDSPAIAVTALRKVFGGRGRSTQHVALSGVTFAVPRGRTTAIVGESGSGKTTLVRCIAGLEKPTEGTVLVHGKPQILRPGHTGPVQMVFQNPTDALDSMRSVGSSIAEPLRHCSRAQRKARVADLLTAVGIDPARAVSRPKGFSGGQLQRIVIARALAPSPEVLLCDEPTSALDVSVQAQIVNLLNRLQGQLGFASIVVTHDLAVARALADDVLVLRDGHALFHGSFEQLLRPDEPLDPYVAGLVRAARESELSPGGTHEPMVSAPGSSSNTCALSSLATSPEVPEPTFGG